VIDPIKQERQLHAVKAAEVTCHGCGGRTSRRGGRCLECERAGAGAERLHRLTVPQLVTLGANVRAELERRRLELEASTRSQP